MNKKASVIQQNTDRNSPGSAIMVEAGKYKAALQQHWPLVLSIGFFFGWLLSFPMQGPLFSLLIQSSEVNFLLLVVMFLSGEIIGLISAGIFGYFFRRKMVWLSAGAIPCIIFSSLFSGATEHLWWLFLLFLGVFSGMANISWANAFASSVPASQRGRTFAMAAMLANIILYLMVLLSGSQTGAFFLIRITGLLPLVMTVCLVYKYRKMNTDKAIQEPVVPYESNRIQFILPFIFAINVVGGLMYSVLGNISVPPSGALVFYGLIPYIILLIPAGILADRVGRRINAVLGAIIVGVGFMSLGIFTGSMQYVFMQTLLIGGYAFLDVFIWIIAADEPDRRKITVFYAAVLGTNVLAILIGTLLSEKVWELASDAEILTVSLAGIFLVISLAFLLKTKGNLKPETADAAKMPSEFLESVVEKLGLTPRESEIVDLLIRGDSTEDILGKLFISANTLKSHLRNIYRKAGVSNRLEFTLSVMKDSGNQKKEVV